MDDKCESQDTGLFTMPSWLCRKSCQNSKPYSKIFMSASYAIFYLLRLTVRLLPKRKLLWLNLSQRYLFLATSTINLLYFFFSKCNFLLFFFRNNVKLVGDLPISTYNVPHQLGWRKIKSYFRTNSCSRFCLHFYIYIPIKEDP